MDHEADSRSRDDALGPIRARVNGRFAKGDLSQLDAHPRASVSMLRLVPLIFLAWLRGEASPSAFFDVETGKPSAEPRVLSEEELREVVAARDAVPTHASG
jgi:hypothetical protein